MPESDKAVMDAILSKEKKGWQQLTAGTFQFVHDHGFGFVIRSQGDWNWLADRVYPDSLRKEGCCRLLEMAMQEVQKIVT